MKIGSSIRKRKRFLPHLSVDPEHFQILAEWVVKPARVANAPREIVLFKVLAVHGFPHPSRKREDVDLHTDLGGEVEERRGFEHGALSEIRSWDQLDIPLSAHSRFPIAFL
jgi:hypothetical protein